MNPSTAILASMAVPLLGGVLILLAGKWPNLRETVTLSTAAILFLIVLSLAGPVLSGGPAPSLVLPEMLPGLRIAFVIEPLGMIFGLVASFLWIVTSLYSIGYMRGHHEQNQTRFYFFFAVAIASTMGVAFSGNMLTLFVCYEVLTISTFPLVAHSGTSEAKRAGRVYLGILLGTSIGLQLVAVVWTWSVAGTLDFTKGGILQGKIEGVAVGVMLALYIFGIGKAAVMPVHRWLPAAMVAPTPVSALLHAVAVVKAGVFTVLKVAVYIFGIDFIAAQGTGGWLIYVAGFTVIVASIIALAQDNLKRRLAYSTVSQLSYVVLATAILAPLSTVGAALHIVAHAFGKITLFFAAGAIMVASHKTEVSQLAGIGRRMPWTMTAFAIGALSMIGVPPTAGFVSKWYILQGAIEAHQMVAIAVIVVSTLLNAGYFIPIVYAAFFRKEASHDAHQSDGDGSHHVKFDHGEAPLPSVIALTVTAAGTVVLFFMSDAAIKLARLLIGG